MLDAGVRDVRNQGVLLDGRQRRRALAARPELRPARRRADHALLLLHVRHDPGRGALAGLGRRGPAAAAPASWATCPGFATPRIVCDVPFVGKRWVHQLAATTPSAASRTWTKNYRTSIEAADRGRAAPHLRPTTTRSTPCRSPARRGGASTPAEAARPTALDDGLAGGAESQAALSSTPCGGASSAGGGERLDQACDGAVEPPPSGQRDQRLGVGRRRGQRQVGVAEVDARSATRRPPAARRRGSRRRPGACGAARGPGREPGSSTAAQQRRPCAGTGPAAWPRSCPPPRPRPAARRRRRPAGSRSRRTGGRRRRTSRAPRRRGDALVLADARARRRAPAPRASSSTSWKRSRSPVTMSTRHPAAPRGQRADDVVGLVAVGADHRDAERLEHLEDHRHLQRRGVRDLLDVRVRVDLLGHHAVRLVRRQQVGAPRRAASRCPSSRPGGSARTPRPAG